MPRLELDPLDQRTLMDIILVFILTMDSVQTTGFLYVNDHIWLYPCALRLVPRFSEGPT